MKTLYTTETMTNRSTNTSHKRSFYTNSMNTKKAFSFRQLFNVLPILFLLISFGASAQLGTFTVADATGGPFAEESGNPAYVITWDGVAGSAGATLNLSYAGSASGAEHSGPPTISIDGVAGATGVIVVVPLVGDDIVEIDETIVLSISSIGGGQTGTITDTGSATMTSEDVSTVSINTGVSAAEGSNVQFTVSMTKASDVATSVTFATSDNASAVAGTDYTAVSTTVTIPALSTSMTQDVTSGTDNTVELNETFEATISALSTNSRPQVTMSASLVGEGTINNDDQATVSISAGVPVGTTDEATQNYTFTVSMDNPVDVGTSMSFITTGGTATNGTDYTDNSGSVNFALNTTTAQTVVVGVVDDAVVELDETFLVRLLSLSASGRNVIFTGSASTIDGTGTIVNVDQATVTLSDPTAITEGDAGQTTLTFTATLSAAVDNSVGVSYATADGSAVAIVENDYDATSGNITFAGTVGETETIDVLINGDVFEEANQNFVVDLSSIVAGGRDVVFSGGGNQATGTINNDDNAEITVAKTAGADLIEGTANQVTYTATLSEPANGAVSVDFDYTGTTGIGDDVIASSGTFSFLDAETTATITFDDNDDLLDEANTESLTYSLASPSGVGKDGFAFVIGTPNTGTFTVTDDDPEPTVTLTAGATNIAEEGGSTTITATLNSVSAREVTVPLLISGSSTAEGADYTLASSITIPANDADGIVSITLTSLTDLIDDDAETIVIDMDTPTNAIESTPQSVTVTIDDNDDAPTVTINPATGTEGGNVVMNVDLSNPSGANIELSFAVSNGSAVVGTDVSGTVANLLFTEAEMASGTSSKTITIATLPDGIDEPDEDFTVSISGVPQGTITSAGTGLGTIEDDADAPPTFNVSNDGPKSEGGSITFTVTLSNASSEDVILDFSTIDGTAVTTGTAADGELDYNNMPNIPSFTFTAANQAMGGAGLSQDVIVTLLQDDVHEDAVPADAAVDSEDFTFRVQPNVSNVAPLGTNTADDIGQISEDDAAPTVTIVAGTEATEGGTQTFTASLNRRSNKEILIDLATSNGGSNPAVSGSDFTAVGAGRLTFEALSTTHTEGNVSVTTASDNIDEGDDDLADSETYSMTGSNAGAASNGLTTSINTVTGNIIDDDVPPTVQLVGATELEGTDLDFVFSISNAPQVSDEPMILNYNTSIEAGDDAESTDYGTQFGTTSFPALSGTDVTVSITTVQDFIDEVGTSASETMTLNASVNSGSFSLDNSQATGTITDNDNAPVLVIGDPTTLEVDAGSNSLATFTIDLATGPGSTVSSDPIVLDFLTSAGSATADVDYASIPNLTTVTIPALGTTTSDVTLNVIGDDLYEPNGGANETFTLTATVDNSTEAGTADVADTGDGEIDDNEIAPEVTISDVTVTEGGQIDFVVSLEYAVDEAVQVIVSTMDGTAFQAAGTLGEDDYTQRSSVAVNFVANDTEETVSVQTTDDNIHEGLVGTSEVMTLEVMSIPTMNASGIGNDGTGTITNDDVPPVIALRSLNDEPAEDGGEAIIDAQLVGNTTVLTVTVSVDLTEGTDISSSDYELQNAGGMVITSPFTLTVDPGDAFSNSQVKIVGQADNIYEGEFTEEVTFAMNAATIVNATPGGSSRTIEIIDAEAAPTVSITSVSETEGTDMVFTVELGAFELVTPDDIVSQNSISILVSTDGVEAVEGTDYTGDDLVVTIPALANSASYTVLGTSTVDQVYEDSNGDETFTLSGALDMSSVGGIDAGGVAGGVGTIVDEDSEPVIELSVNNSAIAEAAGTATITATLTGATTSEDDITIDWSFTGSATGTTDYTHDATSDQIVILAGASEGSFTITAVQDLIFESPDEDVIVDMTVTNGSEGSTNQITVDITDDEPAPEISITLGTASMDEDGSTTITASIDNGVTNSSDMVVDLVYAAATGNTTYDMTHTDLSVKTATVTIPANMTSSNAGAVTGNVNDNDEPDNEAIDITIDGISNGGVDGATATETLTLVDNDVDETVTLSLGAGTITENGGPGSVTTVAATSGDISEKEITVDILYEDDDNSSETADAVDYTAGTQIIIAAGAASNTASISADSDGYYEPEAPETLGISIDAIANGTDGGSALTLNIDASQTNPAVSIGNASDVTEGGALVYTVSLNDEGSGILVSEDVDVTFSVGTGTSGNFVLGATDDYNTDVPTQTVTITSGNSTGTLTIPTLDDALWEDTETLDVDVLAASSANDPIYLTNIGGGLGDVLDNDTAPTLTIATNNLNPAPFNEDDPDYSVVATLSAPAGKDISLSWAAFGGTAQEGGGLDFTTTAPPTNIAVVSGVTPTTASFDIDFLNDGLDENDETIVLSVTSTEATGTGSQTVTIQDAADNLPPEITISVSPGGTQDESVDHTVTATLDAPSGKDITVSIAYNNGSEALANEYDLLDGMVSTSTIVILAGDVDNQESVTLDIDDDDIWEGGAGTFEDLILDVTVPVSVGTLATGSDQFTVTIEDNEATPAVLLSIDKAVIQEDGSVANGQATLTFSLVDPADGVTPFSNSETDVTIPLTITGDATDTEDYNIAGANWNQLAQIVTIPMSATNTTVTLTSVMDVLYEGSNESAFVSVDTPTGADIYNGTQNGAVAILEGDADPVFTVENESAYEEDGMITFTITSTPPSDEDVVIDVDVSDDTAFSSGITPGRPDYDGSTVQITLLAGAATATADVVLTNDAVFEMDETFDVAISHAGTTSYDAALDFTDTAIGTILNDDVSDDPRPTVTLTGDATIAEDGSSNNMITAWLSAISTETVTVNLGVAASSTAESLADGDSYNDFTTGTLSIVIAPGMMSGTTTVTSISDVIDEGASETVVLEITSVNNGTENMTPQEATTTITDDDNAPDVTIDDLAITEDDGTVTFTVNLVNTTSDDDITVNVSTNTTGTGSGFAISGMDFTALSSFPVVISARATSNTVDADVAINDDDIDEVPETFTLETTSTSGGAVGLTTDTGLGTITDDDVNDDTPVVTFTDTPNVTGDEDDGAAMPADGSITFNFQLSNRSSEDVIINFTTADVNAVGGTDYTALSTEPITITAATMAALGNGAVAGSVTVTTLEDDIDEFDETFTIDVVSATGGIAGGAPTGTPSTTGEITDNDNAPVLSFDAPAVSELEATGSLSFPFTLSNPSSGTITVDFSAIGTNTTEDIAEAADFTAMIPSVMIAPGALTGTAVVTITEEAIYELDEELTISVPNSVVDMGGPNNLGSSDTKIGIIENDDVMPDVTMIVLNQMLQESGTPLQTETEVVLSLVGLTELDVTVDVTTNNGLSGLGFADETDDYTVSDNTITIAAGDVSESFFISALDESFAYDEADEIIRVEIDAVTGGFESGTQEIDVTILDDDAPAIVSLSFDASTVDEGTTPGTGNQATVRGTLNVVSGKDISFDIQLDGTGLADGSDYSIDVATMMIAAGGPNDSAPSAATTITTTPDALDEPHEDAYVSLLSGIDVDIISGMTNTSVTILDDDDPPTVDLTGSASVNENVGQITYTATLSEVSNRDITINLVESGNVTLVGSFGDPQDYDGLSAASITIMAGGMTGTVTTNIIDDSYREVNTETLTVSIFDIDMDDVNAPNVVATVNIGTVNTIIVDNESDPTISLNQDDDQIEEDGTDSDFIYATMDIQSQDPVTVNFSVTGTASEGADYTLSSTSITILPGEFNQDATIEIAPEDDLLDELDETVILTSTGANIGAVSGTSVFTTTILDDEVGPEISLSIDQAFIFETGGIATITATLAETSGLDVTVNLEGLVTGLATPDVDYIFEEQIVVPAGSLTATSTLTALSDGIVEDDETVVIEAVSSTNGVISPTENSVDLVILDIGFSVAFVQEYVTSINETNIAFNIIDGVDDATFTYTITGSAPDSGDPITGSGTITDTDQQLVTGLNLSGLTGTIRLKVELANGATVSESQYDEILRREDGQAEVSQGFSPNGDGVNETWLIEGINEQPNNTVTIFNRYGGIVWRTAQYHNTNNAFDGNANVSGVSSGSTLPGGTYFYVINLDGVIIKGFVVIIR